MIGQRRYLRLHCCGAGSALRSFCFRARALPVAMRLLVFLRFCRLYRFSNLLFSLLFSCGTMAFKAQRFLVDAGSALLLRASVLGFERRQAAPLTITDAVNSSCLSVLGITNAFAFALGGCFCIPSQPTLPLAKFLNAFILIPASHCTPNTSVVVACGIDSALSVACDLVLVPSIDLTDCHSVATLASVAASKHAFLVLSRFGLHTTAR